MLGKTRKEQRSSNASSIFNAFSPEHSDVDAECESSPALTHVSLATGNKQEYGAMGRYSPEHEANLDFMKREVKAGVYDTYAVSSALLTGFCVCTVAVEHGFITGTYSKDPVRYWALLLHQLLVRLCTALGLFSMLVFSLSTMYAKTALARQHYSIELYDLFNRETVSSRKYAFWSMYWACILYMVAIGLGFFYCMRDAMAILSSLLIFVVLGCMLWHGDHMLRTAGVLFAPDDVLRKKFRRESVAEKGEMEEEQKRGSMTSSILEPKSTGSPRAISPRKALLGGEEVIESDEIVEQTLPPEAATGVRACSVLVT
jgi:hypothetical protein